MNYLIILFVTFLFWLLYREYSKSKQLLKKKNKYFKQSEDNLRFTIDNFPFLVWLKDKDGRLITVNKPYVKSCLKENIREVESKTDLDLWPLELAKKYRKDDELVIKSGKQKIVKEQIFHQGKIKWFETYKSPVYDSKKNIIGTVGFAMDISERQQYENELKLTSVVFESSYEGIIITDSNTKILKVNSAFTNITGYTQEEVYLQKPSILSSGKTPKEFFKKMWEELTSTGHWSGEIWNKNKDGKLYLEWLTIKAIYDDEKFIKNYVGVFTDISLIKESKSRLNFLAYHDALTGLGNRVLLKERFLEYIKFAEEQEVKIITFFIDLDGFKGVNDRFGHNIGDRLLQIVAKRIQDVTRVDDLIIRFGGDEFVIVILENNEREVYKLLSDKLLNKISEPFEIENNKITISASIGISFYPENGTKMEELLFHADSAMYKVKQKRNSSF